MNNLKEISQRRNDIAADTVKQIAGLNDAYPILLFPLRLECRFKSTGSEQQLWLRVYPDDCNISLKEETLSESELKNATVFWIEKWKAGGIETEERGAWRSLVNGHGSGRAAWIIDHFKPINDPPAKTDSSHKILVVTSPLLVSEAEHISAKNFWISVWLAKGNPEVIKTAFTALKTATSEDRADEIRDGYVPVNLSDAVPDGITADKIFLEKLQLPAYAAKQTSWTQSAKAVGLPDKFVAILDNGGNKREVPFTNPVKDRLAVSPDPSLEEPDQMRAMDGDLKINDELKWMVDFQAAVDVGMAVRITLLGNEPSDGFDKLYVIGIRFSSDENSGREIVEQLLADHHQSKGGFSLLKQGTPTNNTEDAPSGYSWTDDADESFDRIFKGLENFEISDDALKVSDGQRLSDLLGINAEVLMNVTHANGKDQAESRAMNTALFPATLGYFMEEMMDPLFTDADINSVKDFFITFVSGRGPLPALRIGKQPYGILPVTAFSRLKFDGKSVQSRKGEKPAFRDKLHDLLAKMDASWENLVPRVSHVGKQGDAHQILMDVISLQASSVEFHQRYAQSIQQLYNQLTLQMGPFFGMFMAAILAERGKAILRDLNIAGDMKLPILEKYFLGEPNPLNGPLVDDSPSSELNAVRAYTTDNKNYIGWLAEADVEKLRTENFGGPEAPTALLYLLLRHALMLSQADAATQLMVTHNVIDGKRTYFDPPFLHVQTDGGGKSKFESLYTVNPAVTGRTNVRIADHIYTPEILREADQTKRLRETIDALNALENVPTARLERLMSEHLDCCTYRIDAWKTGLIHSKLADQRKIGQKPDQTSKGLYLGAYGWLLDVKPVTGIHKKVDLPEDLKKVFNKDNTETITTDSRNLGHIHTPSLNQAAAAAILRNAFDANRNSGSANTYAVNLTSSRVRIAKDFLEGIRNGQSLATLLGYQFERGLHDRSGIGKVELNDLIYSFRKAFPLVADNLKETASEPTDEIDTVQANNVTDGLKLVQHVQQSIIKTYPFDALPGNLLPAISDDNSNAVNKEIMSLIDIHDAISDLVIAEQVYQVVQGNFERAAGTAEAFSSGGYPPEIEILDTPRTGVALTHRVTLHLDSTPNAVAMNPRATMEPGINKWLSTLLPAPEKVQCQVVYRSPVQPEKEIVVSQENLGLQALDLLYILNPDDGQGMTELDDRIVNYVRYSVSKHPNTVVKINYTVRPDANDASKVSFFELAALVKSVRNLLMGARPLSPSDSAIQAGGTSSVMPFEDEDLKTRVTTLKDSLALIKTDLASDLSDIQSADISLFDDLAEQTSGLFLQFALYRSAQTGIGFIQHGTIGIYEKVFDKIDIVLQRWESKITELAAASEEYDLPGQLPENKPDLLRRMERIVSTQMIPTPPGDLNAYKASVDGKAVAFRAQLVLLQGAKANAKTKITDFITDVETILANHAQFDAVFFDTDNSRNNLTAERQAIASLRDEMATAVKNLFGDVSKAISECEAKISKADKTVLNGEKIALLLDAARQILGEEALVLPFFKMAAEPAGEFKKSYDSSAELLTFAQEKRMLPVEDWLGGIARVREKMSHWEQITSLSNAFNPNEMLELTPMQFPYQPADRWAALEFTSDEFPFKISNDKLLYTAHFAVPFAMDKSQCGIVLDEWTEVIPAREETTGIAFQYDQPNSEPPQTMLLALPPEFTGYWKWEDVVGAIDETLQMAKKRAVDPSLIETTSYAQFLPATMMAVTMHWITIATNLARNKDIDKKL